MNTKFKKIILFIAIDIIGYTIGMGIFLLFFYLIPYELHADGSVVGDSEELATFDFVSEKNRSDSSSHGFNRNSGKSSANRSNTDTEDITYDDEEVQKVLSSDVSYEILETYTADEFDAEAILAEGVWQAWCFGPGLLDGNGHILSEFQSTGYLSGNHPRVAIGYVEPGHFVFTVVDGRNEGYSRGVSLSELAAIMKLENCIYAYNLDGGGSSSMVYNGKYVNDSTSRDITDIIYITD